MLGAFSDAGSFFLSISSSSQTVCVRLRLTDVFLAVVDRNVYQSNAHEWKKKGFNDFFAPTLDSGIFLSQWSNFFFATFAIKSSSQLVCSEYVDGVYERPSLLQMLICQMPERKKKHHLCPQRDVIMTQQNPEEEATAGENPPTTTSHVFYTKL